MWAIYKYIYPSINVGHRQSRSNNVGHVRPPGSFFSTDGTLTDLEHNLRVLGGLRGKSWMWHRVLQAVVLVQTKSTKPISVGL